MTQNQKLNAILRHLDYISNHRNKSVLSATDISRYFIKEFEMEISTGEARRLCLLLIDKNVVTDVDSVDEVCIGYNDATSEALKNAKFMD